MNRIRIQGARTHNLRNLSVDIPRNRFVVITGVSGSGKSSLAFDTIYAEGQRRYLEGLTPQARRLLEKLPRPDVDSIDGLPPTLAVQQDGMTPNRRATLADTTDMLDYLRVLYAQAGQAHCPECERAVDRQSPRDIVDTVMSLGERRKVMVLAPFASTGHTAAQLQQAISQAGFVRVRIGDELVDVADVSDDVLASEEPASAVVDRVILKDGVRGRVQESVSLALKHGQGVCVISWQDGDTWIDRPFNENFACADCNRSFAPLEARSFNPASPHGACPTCKGLGVVEGDDDANAVAPVCGDCGGRRLNRFASAVTVNDVSLPDLTGQSVDAALLLITKWHAEVSSVESSDVGEVVLRRTLPEVQQRLRFLQEVGLEYLTLDRRSATLSGGERQRARLAGCLGSGMRSVCYVLDEPTTGLHPCDTEKLIGTLVTLRDQGNTVIVVEHHPKVMKQADWIIDLGPGAGSEGGRLIAEGTPDEVADNPASLTGRYLQEKTPPVQRIRSATAPADDPRITLGGVRKHNLRRVNLEIPLRRLTCVTGVSGSGKSSLISQTLAPAVRRALAGEKSLATDFDSLTGIDDIKRLLEIDQSPLGRSSRSTPATYTGVWDEVRRAFAKTRNARLRGFKAKRFSFNDAAGRCPACEGYGTQRIDMDFLPDVHEPCAMCRGARFNQQTLSIRYRGKTVADVLDMPIREAAEFFADFPKISKQLHMLASVGLGYLLLGQSALTLSGGEAQRVKLAAELGKTGADPTLFVLDEPTTGLHPADVEPLISVLRRLADEGHTVIVIEHDTAAMRASDWIIDLGPAGGPNGGLIVAAGTPEEVADTANSFTAQALREHRY